MVLKCPKCGFNSVRLQQYIVKKNFHTTPHTQRGVLACSKCDYKEVFGGAF